MTAQRPSPPSSASAPPTPRLRILSHLREVPQPAWDALLEPGAEPFLEWSFLDLLERSGSAVPEKGWTGCHFTLWRGERLVAAAPGWVKTHSMGEFMYNDFRWAAVTPRFGVRYYPKLLLAAPFSPATGPKILVAPDEARAPLVRQLLEGAQAFAEQEKLSSVHVLFTREEDLPLLADTGFAAGGGVQFHWLNDGYRSFDDFLARFNSKRRHMVKTERAQLARDGTEVVTLAGAALTEEVLAFASRCYEATVDKHAWNAPHLTPAFFREAGERLGRRAEVVVAREGGRLLASAFNLRGERRLYGRQWGAIEDRKFLHFNVCYYHSIERAIALGLEAFEPGAGGEHKLARGFEPTLVHSAHWFVHDRLQRAMASHLALEVQALAGQVDQARQEALAFRAGSRAKAD